MTEILVGAGTLLFITLLLLVREVARWAKSARVPPEKPASAKAPSEAEAAAVPSHAEEGDVDAADLTRVKTLKTASAGLPTLVSHDDEDEEPTTDSKALTIFEGDRGFPVDQPTGPSALILLHAVGNTDPGKKRRRNEDNYLVLPDHELFVVADGMGGYAGGDIASKLAVTKLAEVFEHGHFEGPDDPSRPRRANELVWAIDQANRAIFSEARANSEYEGMGTTLLAARFSVRKQRLYIGHVGDSRCYRVRNGTLKCLTVDHTLANKGVTGPMAGNIRRALGIAAKVKVDLVIDIPLPDDVYMICSDGLTKMVSDVGIERIVTGERRLDLAAQQLIGAANEAGGRDNVTVVLVGVKDPRNGGERNRRREDRARAHA